MKRIVGAGGGGGGGCFLGHVPVATPDGTKPIEQLRVGDQVLSFDDKGDIHAATILKVHEHENEKVVAISIIKTSLNCRRLPKVFRKRQYSYIYFFFADGFKFFKRAIITPIINEY